MTKFNPENKSQLTYGEAYGPIMLITDQDDANQYKEALIQFGIAQHPEISRETAEKNINVNIGYYSGYYSKEVQARVERLFKVVHPIFGSVNNNVTA